MMEIIISAIWVAMSIGVAIAGMVTLAKNK